MPSLRLAQYSAWQDTDGKDETVGFDETTTYDDTQDASVFWNNWIATNTTAYGVDTDMDGNYTGERVSPIIDLSRCGVASSSSISWTANTPAGTSITVETNLSTDGGATWGGWRPVTSGGSIPGITNGTNLSYARLQVRQRLSTTNPSSTPTIDSITIEIGMQSGQVVTFDAMTSSVRLIPGSGVKRWQLEQKAYATSWVPGGTTRAAETLTVPTAGVLNPQEGTIEAWVYVDDRIRRSNTFQTLFSTKGTGQFNQPKHLWLCHNGYNNWWSFFIYDDSGNTSGEIWTADNLSIGWHLLTCRWSPAEASLWIDGVKKDYKTSPLLPTSFDATAYIGSRAVGHYSNTLIGPLRISRRARTDQEIADAYAAGILTEDADTTYLLSFRNDSILTNYPLLYNHFSIKPLANNPIDQITDVAHDGTNLWVLVGSRLYKCDENGYEITSYNNAIFSQINSITDYDSLYLLGATSNGLIYFIRKSTGSPSTFINATSTGRQYDCLSFDGKYLWWRDKTTNEIVQFMPSAPYRVVNRIPAVNGSFAVYRSGYFVVKDGKTYKVYRGSLARQLLADFENELKNNRGIVTITDDRGVKIRGLVQDYEVSHLRNLDSVAYKVSMNVRQLG